MTDVNNPDTTGESDVDGGRDIDGQRFVPASKISEVVSKRVNEIEAKNAREKAELRAQIDALAAKVNEPPPKPEETYTREQLGAAVTAGTLTQQQANAIWDRQQEALIRKTAAETAASVVQSKDVTDRRQATIDKYVQKFPDIMVDGTDARRRVAEERAVQERDFGLKGLDADVAALRVVFGRESSLKFDTTERPRQGHEDTLGAGGGSGNASGDPDMPKSLTARERKFYQERIDRGIYKDWKEVAAELKYANPETRRRAAARA